MARRCTFTGKKTTTGYHVSHSNRHVKRKFKPNIHKKRIYIPELKRWVRVKLSTRALRTLNKKGLYATLKTYGLKLEDILS